jgi:hypothetical protein
MCLGCRWAIYRDYFANASTSNGISLTRREALTRGAAFAAATALPRVR